MSDSQEFSDIIAALNRAAGQLQRLERAQSEAAAAAAPLVRSLTSVHAAAEEAGLNRIAALAGAGKEAARAMHTMQNAALNVNALQRCVMRMRMLAAGVTRDGVPVADVDDQLLQILSLLQGAPVEERPRGVPATDENLMHARDEMLSARAKALDVAKLLPMDQLALRVQRLAAIAQDDGERTGDLAPLAGCWLGVPVLVAQLERRYGKKIRVSFMGDSIFVERRLVPVLAICVEQLIRLIAEHSVELPVDRAGLKKPAVANITLISACDNEGLSLSIADDGNGGDLQLSEVRSCLSKLGGGLEALAVPDWGGSVTMAIPAAQLGAWRMQVRPRQDVFDDTQRAAGVA